MLSSDAPSICLVEAQKPKPTSTRRSAFLLAIPSAYLWISYAGIAKLWQRGRCRSSRLVASVRRGQPELSLAHFYLAVALAYLGELDEARAAVQAGLALHPSFTIHRYRASAACDHPAYLAGRERTYEGMRLAGVPEG